MTYEINEIRQPYITWAIVNNKVEWIEGQIEHKDWLRDTFGITHRAFEDTVTGYIQNHKNGKIDIVYFKGSGFDECTIDNKHLAKVLLLTDLCYNFEQISIYSGLKFRKNSEVKRLSGAYKVLTKVDVSGRLISIKQMLDYEDKLVEIINSTIHSNPDVFRRELALCHESLNGYLNSNRELVNHDFKRRLITYNKLL